MQSIIHDTCTVVSTQTDEPNVQSPTCKLNFPNIHCSSSPAVRKLSLSSVRAVQTPDHSDPLSVSQLSGLCKTPEEKLIHTHGFINLTSCYSFF